MLISMHSILGWASFFMNYLINVAWHGGNQPVALLRCNGSPGCFDSGLQVICIVGSGVSHVPLDNTPWIFYGVQVRRVCWPITVTSWSLNQLLVPLTVWAGAKWTWNQYLHKVCQQKEALGALKFPGRCLCWLWTSENTVDQHQQMTWQPKSSLTEETSNCTSSNVDSAPLHYSSRLWDLEFTFIRKEHFGPLEVQFVFSFAQVRCFWHCFCFRSGLITLFLKTSEHGDSWCTHSRFSSLLVKLSQVFESALLDSTLRLVVITVACAAFPIQFIPSGQLCM